MSVEIIDNFKYRGRKPNFDRDMVLSKEIMLNMNPSYYNDGHIVYCQEDGKHYVFKYDEETKNSETGYFSELKTGADGPVLNGSIIESDVWVSNEAPPTTDGIWLDTGTEDSGIPVEELLSMQNAINALQKQVNMLMTMRTSGVIAGPIGHSARQEMMTAADPVIPDNIKDEYISGDEDMEELQPEYSEYDEPTTTHIAIKTGTMEQLQAHLRNLVPGELAWCTDKKKLYIYQDGILIAIGSGGGSISGGDDTENEGNENDNMDNSQVIQIVAEQLQSVESIGFVPIGSDEAKYTVKVNEKGNLVCYNNAMDELAPASNENLYYSDSKNMCGLLVNSYYLGGINNDSHSYQPCSHNFVELSNVWVDGGGKQKDINLNGFYLFYLGQGEPRWKKLKLWGKIPAGGTFLIRGAQCSVMDANTTKLKIRDCDMEWNVEVDDGIDEEGNPKYKKELIKFSQESAVFYLAWGNQDGMVFNFDDPNTPVDAPSTSANLIDVANTKTCAKGYVDMSSFNNSVLCEKNTYTLPSSRNASEVIFRRWYPLDMVTQSNPDDGVEAHNTKKYLTTTYLDSSNISECIDIEDFTPKCSWEKKTIANTRSLFEAHKPSVFTNTFGIQATDNGEGANRGFCWVSVGYYDEYIYIRKRGEDEWKIFESLSDSNVAKISEEYKQGIPEGIHYAPVTYSYPQYYTRMRWETSYGQSVTTHKVILHGLSAGDYEYKVVRKNDPDYAASIIRKFHVCSNEEAKEFTFVQTTDQQGATWEEYEVWNLTARVMKREIDKEDGTIPNDYRFVINTGDICYNGSRSNEWIDYFRGYEPLNDREEMLTIGNNDLIPISIRDLGNGGESPWKINPYIIDYFYAVEMDPRNMPVFNGVDAKDSSQIKSYRIPSLYSFNFGNYHFVSVLSEMRTISNKITVSGDGSSSTKALKQSTVNAVFGVEDKLRHVNDGSDNGVDNPGASAIYDIEEEWLIKDMMVWKGIDIPSDFDRDSARHHEGLVGKCERCIIFTHEMPFNIISDSSYKNYENNADAPRETAKAYLNRYHNFEYQRLWKLWGILLVMGGHKHTCALTRPVYDAPLTYNPITKKISDRGPENYPLYDDDILNDIIKTKDVAGQDAWDWKGMFSKPASFQPFTQLYPNEFDDLWNNGGYINTCNEVYNNSSTPLTFTYNCAQDNGEVNKTVTLNKGEFISDGTNNHPRCRLEIVDKVNSPSYIMCQASGFKNKSNSDLASKNLIPWELFYVKGNSIQEQSYPFYTVYNVSEENGQPKYDIRMYKITGMYDAGGETGSPAGYWNLANIYNHGETVEENRQHYTDTCSAVLYNTGGTILK